MKAIFLSCITKRPKKWMYAEAWNLGSQLRDMSLLKNDVILWSVNRYIK